MMRVYNQLFYLLVVIVLLSACKSQRISTTSKSKTGLEFVLDSTLLKSDTVTVEFERTAISSQVDSTLFAFLHAAILADTITIIGVGDIMLGTNFPKTHFLPPNDGKNLLDSVREILQSADLTFGNHEGVILNDGGHPKYCKNPDICYLFRSPEYLAERLVEAGFDVVSLANNHAGDFGDPGRRNTTRVLDSLGIYNAGLITRPHVSFEMNGVKYGFAAFAPNTGTQSIHDLMAAREIVNHLDSLNDIVIVSFHGGAEGSNYQHVPRKNELFYGEDRGNVYAFSHHMVDAGADIVFGHGPHVSRAIEVYKERFIAYSLGNFCTYARFNLRGPNGVAPIVKVHTNITGKFLKGEIISIKQVGEGIPVPDEDRKALKLIKELTETDFPESKITIDDKGIIKYIQSEI